MKLIVAVHENWGIGKDGDQPFYIPQDQQYFREKTRSGVVVMGRVTFQALPRGPLAGRTNVVLTRDASFDARGVVVCHSLEALWEYLARHDGDDVFVIGGQQIYEMLLDYCDTAYVTKIFAAAAADRVFPDLDAMGDWELCAQSEIKRHEGIEFCFCEYRRTRDARPYAK